MMRRMVWGDQPYIHIGDMIESMIEYESKVREQVPRKHYWIMENILSFLVEQGCRAHMDDAS